YDPPEVRDGGFSAAGDIWSLGMTLVEALTQRLPIPAGVQQRPVLPEILPDAYLDIAGTCLQPDPQWRATVAHTVTRLQRISFQPEEHRPEGPSTFEPLEASPRRRYTAAATVLGLAAVLIASVGILRRRAEPPPAPPSPSR